MFALSKLAKVEALYKSTQTLKCLPNINQFMAIKKFMHILKDFLMRPCKDCSNKNLEILNYTYIYF
jgi:hypothetical protein